MSRMKHLLRKLHIGGGGINDQHHQLGETRASTSTSPSSDHGLIPNSEFNTPSSSVPSTPAFPAMGAISSTTETIGDRTAGGDKGVDFNLLEEEFQVQLALAISASDPEGQHDPESAQINAAKQISLSCDTAITDRNPLVQFQCLRYWNYNSLDYGEKVMDGFYDACHIVSNSIVQGKMPLLVDLQRMSMFGNVDYEVILVDRLLDPELQQLESRAYALATDCVLAEGGMILSGLLQKIADLVVNRMGGPVDDAEEMLRRWTIRRQDLSNSLNTVILPLGCLDLGLSRHRALLFKVLADKVNIPCMLVKGSYYTGTDDGAVNLIKFDSGSEYIIDLMGAPGALIPAEVPSCQLQNSGFNIRGYAEVSETPKGVHLILDGGGESSTILSVDKGDKNGRTEYFKEGSLTVLQKKADARKPGGRRNQTERPDTTRLKEQCLSCDRSSQAKGEVPSPQEMQVRNVSEYVLTAAKDPEFAQKLHAVLLESGASPPLDLFSDINSQLICEDIANAKNMQVNKKTSDNGVQPNTGNLLIQDIFHLPSPGVCSKSNSDIYQYANLSKQQKDWEMNIVSSDSSLPHANSNSDFVFLGRSISKAVCCNAVNLDGIGINVGIVSDNAESRRDCHIYSEESTNEEYESCKRANQALAEALEWEIPWEDLHIGERIGIGSCGEVYHAEWNGTEVAVKKFLDQDFSGDALVQFKYEVEIMLRLRHPNVVLFMGAITRPPHFSILTEFLPRGSLYRLLHRPNSQLDEKRRIRMALDVAKGMNYLHTSHPTIVHRDLKSPNLLVDKNWVVKVCDFGLSRMKNHTFLSSKSTAGTPEWMAPEVLRNEPANEKCDVYSFGVILWELTTLQVPWKGLNPMQVVGAVGFQDRRLDIPGNVDPSVAEIIRDCWQREPHLRPSFGRLMSRLRGIHRLVETPNLTNHSEHRTRQR